MGSLREASETRWVTGVGASGKEAQSRGERGFVHLTGGAESGAAHTVDLTVSELLRSRTSSGTWQRLPGT